MTRLFSVYSPSVHPPEMLERVLVGSQRLVADRAVDAVRASVIDGGCHHLLFVGPRGIGKTHLVAVCFHRLRADEAIEASAVIAWIREEHYGIGSFADLAVAILRSAGELRPDLGLPDPELWEADRESRATTALRDLARQRCVVVLAENLDDLFARIGDAGQKALRALIQETGHVVLVVTSPCLFEGVTKAASAFYGTFDTTHLEELSLDDAHELLRRLASEQADDGLLAAIDAPATRSRLRVIESLAGGHPRIWMLFADSLSVDGIDELVPLFLKALDDLTPYYQERMRDVKGDQERIVMLFCRQPGALSVGEIAGRCGLDETAASSSIARLVTKGFLRRAKGSLKDRRRAFYELREPLMRLCLQVKETRARPVRLIVEFLQGWYDPSEGRALLEQVAPASLAREYLIEAFAGGEPMVAGSRAAPSAAKGQPGLSGTGPAAAHERAPFDEAVAAYEEASRLDPTDMRSHHNRGNALSELGRFDEAVAAYEEASRLDPTDVDPQLNRGNALSELGRFDEAVAAYEEASRLDPTDMRSHHNRGNVLSELGRLDDAVAAYQEASRLDPTDMRPHHNRGITLYELGRFDEALAAYEEAARLDPTDVDPQLNRGNALSELGRFDEAVAAYEEAARLDPTDMRSHHNRGNALSELGRFDEAVAAYEEASRLDTTDVDPHHNRGNALSELGRFDEAVAAYEEASRLDPTDVDPQLNRGNALSELGRFDEAVAAYEEASRLDPTDMRPHHNRGVALAQLSRFDEALAAYEEASRLDPTEMRPHHNRGVALAQLSRFDEALAAYEEASRLDPTDMRPHHYRGVALAQLSRFDEAVAAYEEASRLDPTEMRPHHNRGVALAQLSRFDEAVAAYEEASRLDPTEMRPHHNRGVALAQLSRFDEAVAAYEEASRLDPAAMRPHHDRGNALSGFGRLDEALAAYEEASRLDPTDVDLHNDLGIALAWLGRFNEAVAAYEEVSRLDDTDMRPHFNRGIALFKLGRFDEALAAYDEASRLDPADMAPHHNRGHALFKLGRVDGARQAFRRAASLSRDDPQPVFDRAEVELAADGWAAFVAALVEGFDRAAQHEDAYLGDTAAYCELMLEHVAAPQLVNQVAELVALYAGHSALGHLGRGLVASIPRLLGPAGDLATSAAWSAAWSAAGADHDDLVVPLRILGAAVGWQRDGDDAHFLRLPAEERAVLRDLLPSDPDGRFAPLGRRSGH